MPNSNPITTDLRPTVDLNKFRFWCQKVLPLVYDDSISYYEVLGKMVVYLNQVIDNVNADTENVLTLKEAFDELKAYVDELVDYDISDLEEKLAQAIHAAELATEAEVLAQGYASDASASKDAAHSSAENASASATNAASAAVIASNSAESAAGSAQNASTSATNAANSALNAINQAESASASATAAQGFASTASAASTNATADALKAEGLAVGQQNGTDVDSSSPYYHKNAKYYAEQAGQGAGAYPLADLPDTTITNPTNGQVLAYDSTTQKWVNSDDVEGVTSLDALTDTAISTPTGGQVLMYNQTAGKWVNSAENEIAVSQTAPSSPDTKMWINETAQTHVQLPTMADLGDIDDDITAINTTITSMQTAINGKADSTTVSTALSSKADKTATVTQSAPTALTLADNTEYYLTNVANLTLTFPSGNFECWISVITAGSFTAINFPSGTTFIGDAPTFGAGEKWEISIKNGTVIAGKVA